MSVYHNNTFDTVEQASKAQMINAEVLGDITDPRSDWYDLRVAEMTGYDYVFAPSDRCEMFSCKASLQDFLLHVQTLLGSEPERTILVTYSRTRDGVHFQRYNLDWFEDRIIDASISDLTGTQQVDFIEMLYQHSEKLVLSV